ncbi:MAG: MFS transporter [Nocardioides sp.]
MQGAEGGNPGVSERLAARGRRLVLTASGVSSLGDGMWYSAAPLAAVALDRSPTSVAAVSTATLLPWLLVSPFAGALVDRWPRKAVLVLGDLLRAALVGALVVAFVADVLSITALAAGAFVVVSGGIFHGAAQQSLVADLTEKDRAERDRMNGHMSSLEVGGGSLVGPPAGSAGYAVAPWVPFLVDAISFALSSVMLALLPRTSMRLPRGNGPIFASIRDGATFLLHHRELRTLALLTGAANFATNCALVVLVLYATDHDGLGLSTGAYGWLIAALAIGGVVGGPLAPRLLRYIGDSTVVVASLGIRALVWPALAAAQSPLIAASLLAVAGFASTCVTVTVTSARQRLSPRSMLGRVVTAFRTLGNGAAPIGAAVGGVIASSFGVRATLLVAGAVLAATTVAVVPAMRRTRSTP